MRVQSEEDEKRELIVFDNLKLNLQLNSCIKANCVVEGFSKVQNLITVQGLDKGTKLITVLGLHSEQN